MMLYTIPPLGKMMQYIPFTMATSVNRGTIQSTYTYTYTYTYTPYVERVTIYSWQKKKKKKHATGVSRILQKMSVDP